MPDLLPALIVAVLIALNGLFVAAEFAIVGVSRAEISGSARSGHRFAQMVRAILADPRRQDRFIATAQLGITAASLGLGMYGEHKLAEWIALQLEAWGWQRWLAAHSVASVASITALTYLHIVLGEMVPKSLALQHPGRTVLWVAPMMHTVQLALYPLVMTLNGVGNGLLRLAGIDRSETSSEEYRTPEELAYIVRESQVGGLLDKESGEVVRELLDFGDRMAGEIMVPRVRVVGLPLGAGPEELRSILLATPHTRYPVYERIIDEILGFLHVRDIMGLLDDASSITRDSIREVPFLPETASTNHVLAAMRHARTQLAVIMDEFGGTAGIVTMEDLFEEVVGEITDRSDETPEMVVEGPGQLVVDGAVRLEQVGHAMRAELERDDVDTVSGLVLARLQRPPRIGDTTVYKGLRFEVLSVRGHGVASCRISRTDEER